jgi:hypothetical protein
MKKPLLVSADALRDAGLPDPEPPQRTLPALGSTVIASIADSQLIGAPLCHAPAFVTGYVTDKAKPDDGPVGIEAMILIGNFLSQHLPVQRWFTVAIQRLAPGGHCRTMPSFWAWPLCRHPLRGTRSAFCANCGP